MVLTNNRLFEDVKSFVNNHKALSILTLGLAVAVYSLGNLLGRTVSWISGSMGTTKKIDAVARKQLQESDTPPLTKPDSPTSQNNFNTVSTPNPPDRIKEQDKIEIFQQEISKIPNSLLITPNATKPKEVHGNEAVLKPDKKKLPRSDLFIEIKTDKVLLTNSYETLKNFLNTKDLPESFCHAIIVGARSEIAKGNFVRKIGRPLITLSTIAVQKIAAHYQKKYGITIHVCDTLSLETQLENLKNSDFTFCGLIVTNVSPSDSHSTPLLIHKRNGNIEILILDVIGKQAVEPYSQVVGACFKKNISAISVTGIRQADTVSCRTGACVTLRNALLDVKNRPEIHSLQELLNLQEGQTEVDMSQLPASWTYTDQIFKNKNVDPEYIIRNRFSKKSSKRSHKISVGDVRKKFQVPVEFQYEYIMIYTFIDSKDLEEWNKSGLFSIKQASNGRKTILSWTETLVVNTYMTTKATKYQKLLEKSSK